jgi:hypothetical protein
VRSHVKVTDGDVSATFEDGSPAITGRKAGKGMAVYCAFLPGLSYFHGAIPKRPVDRASHPGAMSHFIPTEFNPGATELFAVVSDNVSRPVICSDRLVASSVIESEHGVLIPLVNWTPEPIEQLTVTIRKDVLPEGATATLASGRELAPGETEEEGTLVYTFPLEVADALTFTKE